MSFFKKIKENREQRTENKFQGFAFGFLKTKNYQPVYRTGRLKTNKGFTLIELMVAVSIFSIVLVIAMGAILTILDANRKARTLTEVMNNLNFSIESITRSVKTGVQPNFEGGVLSVTAIDLESSDPNSFVRETIEYECIDCDGGEDPEKRGYIERAVNGGQESPITSDLLDIESWEVTVAGRDAFNQPRTQIVINGKVKINEKISSEFVIQTTISQRKLNLAGNE